MKVFPEKSTTIGDNMKNECSHFKDPNDTLNCFFCDKKCYKGLIFHGCANSKDLLLLDKLEEDYWHGNRTGEIK